MPKYRVGPYKTREADTIPTDSVPTDAIPTVHSQDDQVHI